jgi:hypothetical protein
MEGHTRTTRGGARPSSGGLLVEVVVALAEDGSRWPRRRALLRPASRRVILPARVALLLYVSVRPFRPALRIASGAKRGPYRRAYPGLNVDPNLGSYLGP